jgi:hypothetical protein
MFIAEPFDRVAVEVSQRHDHDLIRRGLFVIGKLVG